MIIPGTMTKISANSSKINSILKTIGDEVSDISSALGEICRRMRESRITELRMENEKLEKQVEKFKRELIDIRNANGVPQVSILRSSENVPSEISNQSSASSSQIATGESKETTKSDPPSDVKVEKSRAPKQTQPKEKKNKQPETEKEEEAHFGRLDIRVGKIVDVEKHPNADSLYVEKVDVGEEKPRTIISGLVKHVPIEQMKDRIALFLCNLKPAKMRGISSEGMIMCANGGDKVEILEVPAGCVPGEFVTVEGYERNPDAQLSAKKKTFELVQVDLKTNDNKEATYKGVPWNVAGKGPAVSQSLPNVIIK